MLKRAALSTSILGLAGLALVLSGCDKPKERPVDQPTADAVVQARPPGPAWAADYMGKGLRELFPETGDCVGNTETAETRYADGVSIVGWGADNTTHAGVGRVVLVDEGYRVVGAGETGLPRPDVPAARPDITDPNTGWRAIATIPVGAVEAYGVTNDGRGACKLGYIKF